MRAVNDGDREALLLLLDCGADANATDLLGRASLYYALRQVRYIRRHDGSGANEVTGPLDLLVERGADVNRKNTVDAGTPLMQAAYLGSTECVYLLLKRGADARAQDIDGWTALMWAARLGHTEMVPMLLRFGADPTARDNRGWTVLRHATPYPEIVEMLKMAGATE